MVDIRKKWLVGLSFISCIICICILLASSTTEVQTLYSHTEIDDVLSKELQNLNKEYITSVQTREIKVDSLLTRKHYTIKVTNDFNSTFFHSNIAGILHEKGVSIHGIREFPERTLRLSFVFGNTLVRTVEIQIENSSSSDSTTS